MGGTELTPDIPGEAEKCETEPLRILERVFPISATCVRVPIPYGHYATVSVTFTRKPSEREIVEAWEGSPGLDLPTAPKRPLVVDSFFDVWRENGMAISVGQLRPSATHHYQFVTAAHNVIRGAAGGGILTAECALYDSRSRRELPV